MSNVLAPCQGHSPSPTVKVEVLAGATPIYGGVNGAGVAVVYQNPSPAASEPFVPSPFVVVEVRS